MCAVMQTTLSNSMLSNDPIRWKPWYVSDRRIRTKAAAQRAAELAQLVADGNGLEAECDEQALFIALHTCAFRAARCDEGNRAFLNGRKEWSRRWSDIRECIVRRNLGLAYSMTRRVYSSDPDGDDRASEALYGLVRAVERFNPWKGYRFSTYACNVIVRALLRRSRHESRYRGLFPMQQEAYRECSPPSPDSRIELWAERLNRAVEANLAGLTDVEAKVIAHRFPLRGGRCVTFRKIGSTVGLSKERIRQIQNIALMKLRKILENDPVLQ